MEPQYNPSNITVPQISEPQYYNQQQFAQEQTQYNYQQPNQLTVPNQSLTGVQPVYAAANNTTVIITIHFESLNELLSEQIYRTIMSIKQLSFNLSFNQLSKCGLMMSN
ncbi:Hypothetical_protein [Hexamita inflata]|uniref:Hypothetical_protein n=1 Tax=Hexamita inflata TaxID=28002 RepID=A0AA86R1K7_9EUKA|nr:Hypothetical protein HINF_LOCUS57696 [Hexamita inflata]